jgi:hypothetical protein
MSLNIISAADRLQVKRKINLLLLSAAGLGKTAQARTLDPERTLFIDLEAGTLALGDWGGSVIKAREEASRLGCHPWEFCQAISCIIGGPDPLATKADDPYGKEAYAAYVAKVCGPDFLAKFDTVYVDSMTVASRWCFAWASNHKDAFNKQGVPDTRGAYGVLGRELIRFVTHLQHCDKSCIFACILEETKDTLDRVTYGAQIMGQAAGRELPGIIDEVVTLAQFSHPTVGNYRAFVTHLMNPYGFPAKDRSGCLELMEPPDLGKLLEKIRAGNRLDGQMVTGMPAPVETTATPPPQS